MLEARKKAVLYARVSSKKQEFDGFSIPAQLDLFRNYAEKNNIEVTEEFVEAETAKKAGRTKYNEMLKYLKKNKDINIILVEKTDRLYRNFRDYVNLDVDETGYIVHLVKEGVILCPNSTSNEKLQHGFKVLLAKNFIDNLRDETQKGRREKIEEGYFIGQVPYGYKKINKNDTILHPQKAKFVKRAFELYAQGNISIKALSKKLYDEGFIYTPSNPKISSGQLEKLLKNDCYTGLLRYRGQLYQGKHPAIVSKKLFLMAQKAFKKDNKPNSRLTRFFLYRGMLKCAECGCAITSEIKKGRLVYYHCTGNSVEPCPQKKIYLKEEELNEQINLAIQNVVIDDKFADYINMLLKETYKEMQINTRDKYEYIMTEINKLKTRKDKIFDLYVEGDIDKNMWQEKETLYNSQIENFESQLKTFRLTNDKFINEGNNIIKLSRQAYNLYEKQTSEEKRKLLDVIFEKMIVKGRTVQIEYKKPFCYFAKCDLNNAEEVVNYIKQNIA